MSTQNPEQTSASRPEEWKDGELVGETSTPPVGQRHEDYFPLKWYQRRGNKIAGVALGLVAAIGGGIAIGSHSNGEVKPDTSEASTGATVAPEWTPGPGFDYTPSEQTPYLYDTDPSLEEIKGPAVLTADQLTSWLSGDATAQNNVAANVIAPRISVAVHELYDAKKQGQHADVSWLTTDAATLEELDGVADYFIDTSNKIDPETVDWFGFDLCRSDKQAQLDPVLDRCHQNNMPENAFLDLSEGNPMQIVVTRETSANDDSVVENAAYFEFDNSTVRLEGDVLVIEAL